MRLELTNEGTPALLNLLTETIENHRFPLSRRIQVFRDILSKFGPMGRRHRHRRDHRYWTSAILAAGPAWDYDGRGN